MAKPTPSLIQALRATAGKLAKSSQYQWGHMGSCNCGHLAQELTRLKPSEIHQRAMEKYGDWNEQLNDYCPTSGLLMDDLITQMLEAGLDTDDLKHLEKLSDTEVLRSLPPHQRFLKHNVRDHVVLYLNAWAAMLETKWADQQPLNALFQTEKKVTVES
ncbi:hypothetical protein [Fulvivirga sedimenti]|uniref:DUF5069 domain-containing protein n=1 Tax=Fulvivirga sedimenti TaxID=2879465 RepID=A0A9X1HM81_9BACT|nr:hypothetical protein [Fulvivirga sedimenti]MCA6073585.1 hypothetical protein [Fulvivirga sedimenti]